MYQKTILFTQRGQIIIHYTNYDSIIQIPNQVKSYNKLTNGFSDYQITCHHVSYHALILNYSLFLFQCELVSRFTAK